MLISNEPSIEVLFETFIKVKDLFFQKFSDDDDTPYDDIELVLCGVILDDLTETF